MWKIGNEKLIQGSINKGMLDRKIILRLQGAILAGISISVHLAAPTPISDILSDIPPVLTFLFKATPPPASTLLMWQSISKHLKAFHRHQKNLSHSRQNLKSLLTQQSVPLPTRPQNRKFTLYLPWKDKGEVKRKIKTNGHSNAPGCMQTQQHINHKEKQLVMQKSNWFE